jgi:hypothetical protein
LKSGACFPSSTIAIVSCRFVEQLESVVRAEVVKYRELPADFLTGTLPA